MAKDKTVFVCSDCGYECSRWLGQCPTCKSWNSLEEMTIHKETASAKAVTAGAAAVYLKDVSLESTARWSTGFGELDRVLGAGVVEGICCPGGRRTGYRQIDAVSAGGGCAGAVGQKGAVYLW